MVPGTGVHVNNMLGEQDLNPFGFHAHDVGRRLPSMMSPTVVLRDGELEAGLGSGGSNRIRSAILQTVVRLVCDDLPLEEAVFAPRVHFEDGAVQAEPGVDDAALAELERRGYEIVRWSERNVFFGGVHAVARDPATGRARGRRRSPARRCRGGGLDDLNVRGARALVALLGLEAHLGALGEALT